MPISKKASEKARQARQKSGKVKKINLALQGGGSHGAFTWGVLDRILDEDSIEIEAISATSAGAMNGALLLYGLDNGGKKKAKELLHSFWHKVSTSASMSPFQPSFFEKFIGAQNMPFNPGFQALDYMTRMFSPYQLNIFDINPLKDIIQELIKFDKLRRCSSIKLFINATNVRNCKIKIFDQSELTADKLMASACLPYLFKTVEVEGEHYWDGGYSGNPALYPLLTKCMCQDIVIVQINPITVDEVPKSAHDILDRMNEISFNTTLMREVRSINLVTKLLQEKKLAKNNYKEMLIHMIEAEDIMESLGHGSKFNADWEFLQYLRDAGAQAAEDWINDNYDKIGKQPTIDIRKMFLDE